MVRRWGGGVVWLTGLTAISTIIRYFCLTAVIGGTGLRPKLPPEEQHNPDHERDADDQRRSHGRQV